MENTRSVEQIDWPPPQDRFGFDDVERQLFTKRSRYSGIPKDIADLVQRMQFVRFPMNQHSGYLVEWISKYAGEYLKRIEGGLVYDHACCDSSAVVGLAQSQKARGYIGSDIAHVKNEYYARPRGTHLLFVKSDALDAASRMGDGLVSLSTLSGLDGGGALGANVLPPFVNQDVAATRDRTGAVLGSADASEGAAKDTPADIHRGYLVALVRETARMLKEGGLFILGYNGPNDQPILVQAAREAGLRQIECESAPEVFMLFEK